ncbi:MAG: hypothetical protein ACPGZP_10050, partial [Panacagrimonas sp.]
MRWIGLPPLALLVVAALFLLMHWMIRPPGGIDDQIRRQLDGIELTKPPPPEEPTPEPTELLADSPPPPPAGAPPQVPPGSLRRPFHLAWQPTAPRRLAGQA